MKTKHGPTQERWQRAIKDKAFDGIRGLPLIETQAEHLLRVLEKGTVSTNVHLRKLHNFCLDMSWLPWAILPKRQWPPVQFREKRAVLAAEHTAILAQEKNPERRSFYALCWHLGASQGDTPNLKAEDVDWKAKTIGFTRKKTGVPVIVNLGKEALNVFKDLPSEGLLFPNLQPMRAAHRATEFKRCCRRAGVSGVTLHSYRYVWSERAKATGYPERYAMEALGHNSKAVHRAYAKKAQVKLPALEEYERAQAKNVVGPRKVDPRPDRSD